MLKASSSPHEAINQLAVFGHKCCIIRTDINNTDFVLLFEITYFTVKTVYIDTTYRYMAVILWRLVVILMLWNNWTNYHIGIWAKHKGIFFHKVVCLWYDVLWKMVKAKYNSTLQSRGSVCRHETGTHNWLKLCSQA